MNKRAAVACEEMVDIRRAIDALDKKLVAMLVERQALIKQAGKVKPSRSDVRDEARIAEVLALVKQEANKQGLSTQMADAVWRVLIEESINYEFGVFDGR